MVQWIPNAEILSYSRARLHLFFLSIAREDQKVLDWKDQTVRRNQFQIVWKKEPGSKCSQQRPTFALTLQQKKAFDETVSPQIFFGFSPGPWDRRAGTRWCCTGCRPSVCLWRWPPDGPTLVPPCWGAPGLPPAPRVAASLGVHSTVDITSMYLQYTDRQHKYVMLQYSNRWDQVCRYVV